MLHWSNYKFQSRKIVIPTVTVQASLALDNIEGIPEKDIKLSKESARKKNLGEELTPLVRPKQVIPQ